jgi:hypothetical protein
MTDDLVTCVDDVGCVPERPEHNVEFQKLLKLWFLVESSIVRNIRRIPVCNCVRRLFKRREPETIFGVSNQNSSETDYRTTFFVPPSRSTGNSEVPKRGGGP